MKFKVLYLFVALMAVVLPGCSDDDNNNGKVKVEEGTTKKISANAQNLEIRLHAESAWSATVSAESRADVDWLSITPDHGPAGESTISCTINENTTGSKRVAYVVITSEGGTVNVKIEQSTESEPENRPNAPRSKYVTIECSYTDLEDERPTLETRNTIIEFNNDNKFSLFLPVSWETKGEDYTETAKFYWSDYSVVARYEYNDINPATGSVISVEKSTHKATFDITLLNEKLLPRVVSGSYKWDDDPKETTYTISYNSDHRMVATTIDDSEPATFHSEWDGDNLVKIFRDAGNKYFDNIKYFGYSNLFELLDINWVTVGTQDECYNFAGGDPSMIWAAFGYLGRSANLILALEGHTINSEDQNTSYTYRPDYTLGSVTLDSAEVEVKEYLQPTNHLTYIRNYKIRTRDYPVAPF